MARRNIQTLNWKRGEAHTVVHKRKDKDGVIWSPAATAIITQWIKTNLDDDDSDALFTIENGDFTQNVEGNDNWVSNVVFGSMTDRTGIIYIKTRFWNSASDIKITLFKVDLTDVGT